MHANRPINKYTTQAYEFTFVGIQVCKLWVFMYVSICIVLYMCIRKCIFLLTKIAILASMPSHISASVLIEKNASNLSVPKDDRNLVFYFATCETLLCNYNL